MKALLLGIAFMGLGVITLLHLCGVRWASDMIEFIVMLPVALFGLLVFWGLPILLIVIGLVMAAGAFSSKSGGIK